MARTKRGTKQVKPTVHLKEITVRMPDGENVETVGLRCKEFWIVKVPYDCEGSKRKFDFEHGLKKSEFGLYIRQRQMWIYRRSERTVKRLRQVLKAYVYWAFDGNRHKFDACIEKMKAADSRKHAKQILDFYIRKYGYWTFGWFYLTRTQGYDALLKREMEFKDLYWRQKPVVRMSPRILFCEDEKFWPR